MVLPGKKLLMWDVYELSSSQHPLTGVSMRRRIRNFSIAKSFTLITDNTEDKIGHVRFAVLAGSDITLLQSFLELEVPDIEIKLVLKGIPNPVLSKVKVNLPKI